MHRYVCEQRFAPDSTLSLRSLTYRYLRAYFSVVILFFSSSTRRKMRTSFGFVFHLIRSERPFNTAVVSLANLSRPVRHRSCDMRTHERRNSPISLIIAHADSRCSSSPLDSTLIQANPCKNNKQTHSLPRRHRRRRRRRRRDGKRLRSHRSTFLSFRFNSIYSHCMYVCIYMSSSVTCLKLGKKWADDARVCFAPAPPLARDYQRRSYLFLYSYAY